MGRRWLHSVDLETDGEDRPLAEQALIALGQAIADGRVKVDASGVTLEADVIDVDVEAITGGSTQADIVAALAALAGTNVSVGAVGSVSVGSSTTVVLAAGAKRERVVLVNDSDEKIYLAVGVNAESAKGIPLAANGGAVTLTPSGGCKLAVNAICASGGKALAYQTLSTP